MKIKNLPFEEKISEMETQITNSSSSDQIEKLHNDINAELISIYSNLSPWQKVLVARHDQRPLPIDYIDSIVGDFFPICGDKSQGEDVAVIAGFGSINDTPVFVCGNNKGKTNRQDFNYGMAYPEGYRKFLRAANMANDFGVPIVTFVDTPGAFPGVKAEERGQSYMLAKCIQDSFDLSVPLISIITGEGGSGGALAMSVGNKIMMLEHSIYSVISPEGCAAILWKEPGFKEEAAKSQKMTAKDLLELGIIDQIIPEPVGGAHRNYGEAISNVKNAVVNALQEMSKFTPQEIISSRENKFTKMTRQFLYQ
jgi:acetyl-CoA carboxylase carboxyl transferase subunit alpha